MNRRVERECLDANVLYWHFLEAVFLPSSYSELHILVGFSVVHRKAAFSRECSPLVFFPFHFQAAFKNMGKSFLCTSVSPCTKLFSHLPRM